MNQTSQHVKQDFKTAPYHKNIEVDPASPDFEFEQTNVENVFSAMDNLMRIPTLVAGSVMPDACPTGESTIPVGGVVVAENAIHPGFHSADICCSVMSTNLGQNTDAKSVLDVAEKITHFGPGGRKRSAGFFKHLTRQLEERIRANPLFSDNDLKKAQLHLGTQGDGNHFLFVGKSESDGATRIVTHHGSRGFGAGLYHIGKALAESHCKSSSFEIHKENYWIPADSPEGQQYWDALQIVRDWTRLNHEVIHAMVAKKMGLNITVGVEAGESTIWNEHNFVFKKPAINNDGKDLYFHAKGATPLDDAFVPDSREGLRLIPLNMAQPILVVRGNTTESNLGFAPHGAGRNMSRTKHKQNKRENGITDQQIFLEETHGLDVRFYLNTIDISELPSAYKNAASVQNQISKFNLGEVVDRITPFGCIMAGSNSKRIN